MCRLVDQKFGTWLGGRLSTPKRAFRVAGINAGPCPFSDTRRGHQKRG